MIYTVTLNPILDRIVEVEELIYDNVNTIVEEKKYPVGKGIDVSRVIKELGGQSIAMGFVGGYNGLRLSDSSSMRALYAISQRYTMRQGRISLFFKEKRNCKRFSARCAPR